MHTIQANPKGTRAIMVSDDNLVTIKRFSLFRNLVDSNGIIDELVLDKLKFNIRSLIASQDEENRELLDLYIDVIYHKDMKAFGLQRLLETYRNWVSEYNPEELLTDEREGYDCH